MPKNKPKETIEFVIRLQDKERQMLDDFVATRNFNQVASPVISLLKDVSGLAACYVILTALFPDWAKGLDLKAMRSMDSPGVFDYLEKQNLALGIAGAAAGVATGGLAWLPAILGFALGQVTAEVGEEAYKIATNQKGTVGFQTLMFGFYMAAWKEGIVA